MRCAIGAIGLCTAALVVAFTMLAMGSRADAAASSDQVVVVIPSTTTTTLPGRVIVFNPNGGTGTMANQSFVGSTTLNPNRFTRSGYSFAGWATTANGSVAYADASSFSAAADSTLYAVWTINTYTLSFNANGGNGALPNLSFTVAGRPLTGNTFTRIGYTFGGWSDSPTGPVVYRDGATYNTPGNATLYAVWSAITYTVTFDANGGSGTIDPLPFTVAGVRLTRSTLTRQNYTFTGWSTTRGGAVAYSDGANFATAGDVTLYAVWTPITYTLTFNSNGGVGSMSSLTFTVEGRPLAANSFTRNGYAFAGWSSTIGGAVEFTNQSVYSVAGNVTLYAVWTPLSYAATFNANGGSGKMAPGRFTSDGTALDLNQFTRVGYSFIGWSTSSTGTVQFSDGATYSTPGNVTLYAVWTPIQYSLAFDANGGSGSMPNQTFTVLGTALSANTFTRANYTFAGWATTPTGSAAFANGANYSTAGNTTLYAVWTPVSYSVTFNANGGSGTMAPMTFTVLGRALTTNTFTRTGYSFAGWSTTAGGPVVYQDGALYNTAGNVTLFASWTAAPYVITFDANGGTGSMAPQNFSVTGANLTPNAFTRSGYSFAGWATSATGSVTLADRAAYSTAGNVTLYAVWAPITYSIAFNANGGSGNMANQSFTVTGVALTATAFTRTGYTFAGWGTTATGPATIADRSSYSTPGNVTLFAVWNPVNYAITFNSNGGTGNMSNQSFTVTGVALTANAFTRTGYTFAGWSSTSSGVVSLADRASYSTPGNVTLYAVWTPVNYSITFDANGGTGSMASQSFTVTGATLSANTFARTGYTFSGWATTATGAVAATDRGTYSTAGNVTLFAVWTATNYTVTFNANGGTGTMSAMSFTVTGRALSSNSFTRAGYQFAGWATAPAGAVSVNNGATYSTPGNITLYAVWTPLSYTVTFNLNGGTGKMAPQTFTASGTSLTANAFTRAGYQFAGWATTATGSVAYADRATYSTPGNVTLFAVWTTVTYTLAFNANGGSGTMASSSFTVAGITLPNRGFSRSGYTFAGWATSATGPVAFANQATYNTPGNATLYAVWLQNYTITFNANGGSGTMGNQTFTTSGVTLARNSFTRTGRTFAGWATTATGTVAFADGATYNTAGNVTLYAVWR